MFRVLTMCSYVQYCLLQNAIDKWVLKTIWLHSMNALLDENRKKRAKKPNQKFRK